MIALAGGESRQVTAAAQGVSEYGWSPEGKRLVICAGVDPGEPGVSQPVSGPPEVRVVQRIRYRYDGLGWRGNLHTHLFTVSWTPQVPRRASNLPTVTGTTWRPSGPPTVRGSPSFRGGGMIVISGTWSKLT